MYSDDPDLKIDGVELEKCAEMDVEYSWQGGGHYQDKEGIHHNKMTRITFLDRWSGDVDDDETYHRYLVIEETYWT